MMVKSRCFEAQFLHETVISLPEHGCSAFCYERVPCMVDSGIMPSNQLDEQ